MLYEVITAATVLAQLVQDLFHIEGGQDRLDQHGGADATAGNTQRVLRVIEYIIPQT